MTTVQERLAALGLSLPQPAKPVAAYVPAVQCGPMVFVSGQIPLVEGALMASGTVPSQVAPDLARACARQCALNGLAAAAGLLGGLDRVRRVVRVGVFVASDPGFTAQSQVANGASELLQDLFGEAGRHARAAVGAPSLPLGAPVEVEMILEVAGDPAPPSPRSTPPGR
jgi:enamine deaminase RidA (YjgF/YER057c/UK114 family)